MSNPVSEANRIETLDVLRGFALLGILVINITAFGLSNAAYTAPALINNSMADTLVWGISELTTEGSMRTLFSILFGAGVVLFLGREDSGRGRLHYKRTFWLLLFGLFNSYILLWPGDILFTYALAGFILYFFRNVSGRGLLITSGVLLVLLTAYTSMMHFGLNHLRNVEAEVALLKASGEEISAEQAGMAEGWRSFADEMHPDVATLNEELNARGTSYATAFDCSQHGLHYFRRTHVHFP